MRPETIYEHPELSRITKAAMPSVGYADVAPVIYNSRRGIEKWAMPNNGISQREHLENFHNFLVTAKLKSAEINSQGFFSRCTASNNELSQQIDRLLTLKYNWDGEGASPPSAFAASSARVICENLPSDIKITEVEADVIGGIVLWVEPRTIPKSDSDKLAWFAVRNSGKVMLTCEVHRQDGFLSVDDVSDCNLAAQKIRDFFSK